MLEWERDLEKGQEFPGGEEKDLEEGQESLGEEGKEFPEGEEERGFPKEQEWREEKSEWLYLPVHRNPPY